MKLDLKDLDAMSKSMLYGYIIIDATVSIDPSLYSVTAEPNVVWA